jgi:hypothetical protein
MKLNIYNSKNIFFFFNKVNYKKTIINNASVQPCPSDPSRRSPCPWDLHRPRLLPDKFQIIFNSWNNT